MGKRGPSRVCRICGGHVNRTNIKGYCRKCLYSKKDLIKTGKVPLKFSPKVTVVLINGKKVIVG